MSHEEGKAKASQRQGVSREKTAMKPAELPASWREMWEARKSRKARLDTTNLRECTKCHRSDKPVFRHHKGFDSLTGLHNKSIIMSYHKYLDCTLLCEDCHCEIHFIYERYVKNWINRTAHGARQFRVVLIGVCDDWLAGRVKTPSIPAVYRKRFHQSLLDWQRRK